MELKEPLATQTWVVDPHLLDAWVVEVLLERSVTSHPRHQVVDKPRRIPERLDGAGQTALIVGLYHPVGDDADGVRVSLRIQTVCSDPLSDELGQACGQ